LPNANKPKRKLKKLKRKELISKSKMRSERFRSTRLNRRGSKLKEKRDWQLQKRG
jgi:hypothetical protein